MSDLPTGLQAFLRAATSEEPEETPKLAPDIEAELLRDALASHQIVHHFVAGMIVRQKPAAGLYHRFGNNDLAIVVEVLCDPILDGSRDPSSPYYRLLLDLRIGFLSYAGGDAQQCFPVMYVSSQYFEPVPAGELALIVKERK